jgi:hypothetical protein
MLDYQAGYQAGCRAAVHEGAHVKLIDRVTGVIAGGPQPWRDLGYARRRQVLRLARRGLLYPDPEVWAIATAWARWQLTLPPSRRLLRAIAVAVSVGAAIGIAVLPLVFLLPGEVTVVQNYGWVILNGWQLGALAYRFGVIPWLDARDIDRLPWSSSPHEAVSG